MTGSLSLTGFRDQRLTRLGQLSVNGAACQNRTDVESFAGSLLNHSLTPLNLVPGERFELITDQFLKLMPLPLGYPGKNQNVLRMGDWLLIGMINRATGGNN